MYQEETLQRRRSINDDPESREILKKFKDDKQKLESILVGLPTNRQEIGQGRQNQVKACLLITGAVIVVRLTPLSVCRCLSVCLSVYLNYKSWAFCSL